MNGRIEWDRTLEETLHLLSIKYMPTELGEYLQGEPFVSVKDLMTTQPLPSFEKCLWVLSVKIFHLCNPEAVRTSKKSRTSFQIFLTDQV